MKTNTYKYRFHQLAALLLIAAMAGTGYTQNSRGAQRGQGSQRSAERASAPRQSQPQARPAPQASQRTSRAQAAPPRQQAAPQPSQRSRSQQPAQSARAAAPSTQRQTPASVNRQSVQAAPQRSAAPARPVNRTVEVASRADRNTVAAANRNSNSVSIESRGSSNSSTARAQASSISRTTPAAARTPVTRASVTEKVSARTSTTTRQPVIDKVAATPTTRQPNTERAASRVNENQSAARRAVNDKVAASTTPDRSITNAAAKTETRTTRETTRSNTTAVKNREVTTRIAATEKTADAVAPRQRTASVRVETDSETTRTREKTAPLPQRVRVGDIKTEPQRVTAGDLRTRPSTRELEQKRAVRIQSETRPARTADITGTAARTNTTRTIKNITTTRRTVRRVEPASKIVINNDNRVIVRGAPTRYRPRPYISRRLFHDVSHFHSDPHWFHYGSGFYFRWSSHSRGVVVSLPYYHSSIHYGTPYYGLSYYYPSYHRKYVFVSVGGYWPYDYNYRRYYWYGCHPYYWYGSRVIYDTPDVNNYNTYNYYNTTTTTDTGSGFSTSAQPYYNLGNPKEEEVVDEPEFESAADLSFDHAVTLFEAGNYDAAVEQFREAVTLSPDDIILPFTYSQALFAKGDYGHAASVLRTAMLNIPDEELTIYYPRGLYEDETVLTAQIDRLREAAEKEPFASDYQLLLGYHYLGLGELQRAALPLTKAAEDPANEVAAGKLLQLAAQLEEEARNQNQEESGS